jgi:hypothetical protein
MVEGILVRLGENIFDTSVILTTGVTGAKNRRLKHSIRANTQITANPNDIKKAMKRQIKF